MRIDKYLWCVRIFKTRNLASKACDLGKIRINDQLAKASRIVKINDTIKVKKNYIEYNYQILDFPLSRVGAPLVLNYCKDLTPNSELEKLNLLRLNWTAQRDPGTGRPTKKERRNLDDFFDENEILDEDDLI